MNFRKSIKIGKNTRVNFSKGGGFGVSTGVKGYRKSINKNGVRTTTSIPGTGVYSTNSSSWNNKNKRNAVNSDGTYILPEGVSVTKISRKRWMLTFIGLALVIIGYYNIPILLIAAVYNIVNFIMLLKDREYRISYNEQLAIFNYQRGKFVKCYKYCKKILKLDSENTTSKLLLKRIEEIIEDTE